MTDAWFRFFPSDWLGGVAGLSAAERGVYISLLACMYDAGVPIAREDDRLARQCGLPKAGFVRALAELVRLGKIIEENGCLFNPRVKSELTERDARRVAASGAANSRWEKEKQIQHVVDASAYASARSTQCEQNAPEVPRPEPQPNKSIIRHQADFERLRLAYPRRPGDAPKPAMKAFIAAIKRGHDTERIISGAAAYARSRVGQDPQFTKTLSAWLNAEMWDADWQSPPARGSPFTSSKIDAVTGKKWAQTA